MSKEAMLRRAFHQAITNDAVNYADKNADFLVIKNQMTAYAKKHNVSVSTEEIESFINAQRATLDAAVKDFTYMTKIMN